MATEDVRGTLGSILTGSGFAAMFVIYFPPFDWANVEGRDLV